MRPVRCQAAKHRFCPFGGLSRTPGSSASLRSGCPSPGSSRSSFFIREAEPRGCLLPHSSPLVFCWLNFWLCLRMQGFPDQGPASPGSDKAESCSARAPGTPPAPRLLMDAVRYPLSPGPTLGARPTHPQVRSPFLLQTEPLSTGYLLWGLHKNTTNRSIKPDSSTNRIPRSSPCLVS